MKRAVLLAVSLAAILAALRIAPAPALKDLARHSTAVYAADGRLLRLTTAADEQYRLWTPLAAISPHLTEAVLRYEDRWYRWHPGVNPAALARSAWATASGERRQGGSTLTMQLARRVYGIDSREVPGKLKQIAAALWLEARYGKDELLEAYLNVAPYGGNVEGVGAASLVYFHKRAAHLTLPEALTLAVIPQNPAARGGANANSPALAAARGRMAAIWLAAHPADERLGARHAVAMKPASALPFRAPHLVNQLLKERKERPGEIFTALDPALQSTVERVIARHVERHRDEGVANAAALLIDADTMQVKALVGSAAFHDDAIDGQVNGVLAKRSPGSTLKPFIYALAFDQGVLHPMTVLKDAPTAFGPFSPENFDGRFAGPITAQEALTRSRNVPAVAVAAKLTRPTLHDLLKASGVTQMASEKHYGLALTLGGGEVTMEELARLYAMLANGGELRALQYTFPGEEPAPAEVSRGRGPIHHQRLLSPEAAFVTLDMLESNPRPDTGQPALPSVAWKTGTSWGFRDAWTAGVAGRHVLVVWVGNFDGSGNPAFIGVQNAAPLFFGIVDAMRSEGLAAAPPPRLPPAGLTRVAVCAASGELPNAACPQRVATWYAPGKSPIRVSTLHRRVLVDRRSGEVACAPSAHTEWQVVEAWPSDMRRLFREAGMPRREAPAPRDCGEVAGGVAGGAAPQIVSPLRAVTYTARLSRPAPLALRAEAGPGKLFWFANEAFVGEAPAGEGLAWTPPKAGRYVLRAVDEAGLADSREVSVEMVP